MHTVHTSPTRQRGAAGRSGADRPDAPARAMAPDPRWRVGLVSGPTHRTYSVHSSSALAPGLAPNLSPRSRTVGRRRLCPSGWSRASSLIRLRGPATIGLRSWARPIPASPDRARPVRGRIASVAGRGGPGQQAAHSDVLTPFGLARRDPTDRSVRRPADRSDLARPRANRATAGPIRPAAPAMRRTSRSDRSATRPGHGPAAGVAHRRRGASTHRYPAP